MSSSIRHVETVELIQNFEFRHVQDIARQVQDMAVSRAAFAKPRAGYVIRARTNAARAPYGIATGSELSDELFSIKKVGSYRGTALIRFAK